MESLAHETTKHDDDTVAYEYVLLLIRSHTSAAIAAILSNRSIRIYGDESLTFRKLIKGFPDDITGAVFSPVAEQLYVATVDGTVGIWDIVSGKRVGQFKVDYPLHSIALGCGGDLLALGCYSGDQGITVFIETKGGSMLGKYTEGHVERITCIIFHPIYATMIATASEDGLVNLYDVAGGKEEDSLRSVINSESAVTKVGWCGVDLQHIFVLTQNEGISVWDMLSVTRVIHIPDIRVQVASSLAIVHVEYIVDCFFVEDSLCCLIGDHSGTFHLVRITSSGVELIETATGGHASSVRSSLWLKHALFTGGEDARLCMWVSASSTDGGGEASTVMEYIKDDTGTDSGPVKSYKSRRAKHIQERKPY